MIGLRGKKPSGAIDNTIASVLTLFSHPGRLTGEPGTRANPARIDSPSTGVCIGAISICFDRKR